MNRRSVVAERSINKLGGTTESYNDFGNILKMQPILVITSVEFQNQSLTATQWLELSQQLANLPHDLEVIIEGYTFGNQAFSALANVPRLRYLEIVNSSVGEKEFPKFSAKRPDVKLWWHCTGVSDSWESPNLDD